ncbi:RNA polymerase subunit sigma-24 [Sphaerisporangium melleum]|uniref:RNA polymerase subunit sigma-24 n=1 Tax=Sphaerisporangium melleum TaxID=321316 RepID=A0A917R2J6_9ACTN|nr:RNA polymerase sigma factor [Sphaerisporangium melleum]GGK86547.1 RNA polymerase subunit sigma-24 [Sphaerisporangium melleum]GII71521.1 RNA polymerase subunit sigma-24 [Sphaerisporangium melleum]
MDVRRTIEAVWRMESGPLVAHLARVLQDVGLAEEIAQEAFAGAVEQWPREGVPRNPGAWLTTTAKRRAIDLIRRERMRDEKYARFAADLLAPGAESGGARDAELLSLIFVACHPVLSRESRAALALRLVGGLSTEEIARAFLVPTGTMAQRITRAKRTLAEAQVPFEVPGDEELPVRLSAVLEVVYLIFNEGYAGTSGEAWIRRDLAEEAMRLGRILAGLMPREPEVHGLAALMELQASRFRARTGPDGTAVLLQDQDRSRWDRTLITHGLASLAQARRAGRPLGPYTVQAAIAACHARARRFEDTDWEAIVALYDALAQLAPSPVVELNRAVAVLHADGPEAALKTLDAIGEDPRMARYHLLGAVRGDVLLRLGRHAEAAAELQRAADLAPTARERLLLNERAAAATPPTPAG